MGSLVMIGNLSNASAYAQGIPDLASGVIGTIGPVVVQNHEMKLEDPISIKNVVQSTTSHRQPV